MRVRYKDSNNVIRSGQISLGPKLPLEYQEVEFIESTGTQVIDTQWVPTSNSKIELKFQVSQLLSGVSDQSLFGLREGNYRFNLYLFQTLNTFSIGYGTAYNESALPILLNQDYSIIYTANGTNATLSGDFSKTVTSSTTPVFTQTLWLFYRRQSQQTFASASKIKICKIYDNDILVRDFVPCYRKSDNEIGLYDLVGKQFYTNQGTGTFLKGNNVNNTISCKVAGGSSDIYYGYNQHCSSSFDTNTGWGTHYGTLTADDGVATFTLTQDAQYNTGFGVETSTNNIAGHIYLLLASVKHTTAGLSFKFRQDDNYSSAFSSTTDYQNVSWIRTSTGKAWHNYQLIFDGGQNGEIINVKNCMNIDLTDWYGAGNEPTTIEEFKATFPNKYYTYSKKRLLNKYMINKLIN